MSCVLTFFPPDARYVGIPNNINDPSRHNRLAEKIAAVVRDHRGPSYALSFPAGKGRTRTFAPIACARLRQDVRMSVQTCQPVRSNYAAWIAWVRYRDAADPAVRTWSFHAFSRDTALAVGLSGPGIIGRNFARCRWLVAFAALAVINAVQ